MGYLIKRNLLVFFKNKLVVFYSLLSVIIIIGLYILFLGDTITSNIEDLPNMRFVLDSWIMAGVIAVTTVTTLLTSLGTLIEDKENKIYKDFVASPIKRSYIVLGYISSSFIISTMLTIFTFIFAEIYIVMYGGELLTPNAFMKVLLIILLNEVFSCFMCFLIVSSFKNVRAFSTALTIIGTLIGFLTGIYVPIGSLPSAVQTLIKIFPPSHVALLLRKVMTEQAMDVTFAGVPMEYTEGFETALGISFKIGDKIISPVLSVAYLLILSAIFLILSIKINSRKEK